MHEPPCEPLKECQKKTTDRLDSLEESMASVHSNVIATREIIEAWNNGRGFVTTIRVMSKIVVWLGVTGAAITGIYHAIKHLGE